MIKTGRNNSANLSKAIAKIRNKKKEKSYQSSHQNVCTNSLGNDIVVSPAGQFKIDNLTSCLSLDESDFIIF